MNIFIAGGHGVGKTFLTGRLQLPSGMFATSASKLIKEERGQANWNVDKRVAEVDENQVALASAVRRHNDAGTRLLLDGHFVLLDAEGALIPLSAEVFATLNLSGVILLQAHADVVAQRILERDGREADLSEITAVAAAEQAQANQVCCELGLTMVTMPSPRLEEFAAFVELFAGARARAD